MENDAYKDLVEREKNAHQQDDVLSNSFALKNRFAHTLYGIHRQKFESKLMAELDLVNKGALLDYGCGLGTYIEDYAKLGYEVHGIDIAENYVAKTKTILDEAGFSKYTKNIKVMDAHSLNYADSTFQVIVGRGILLKLFRMLTPNARTEDEKPFFRTDLKKIESMFNCKHHWLGLCTAPAAILTSIIIPKHPNNVALNKLSKLENILNRSKIFQPYNQYVIFVLAKNPI